LATWHGLAAHTGHGRHLRKGNGTMEKDGDGSFLGAELRRARLAAGIKSQEELAGKLGFDRTVIAKAESGLRPPSPDVARAYAREFPELNALVESGLIERWAEHVKKNGGVFPKFLHSWIDNEQTATGLFYWEPMVVPGILQIEAYARAILAADPNSDETVDARVAGRLERQQILSRPHPPMVSVVLAEDVLNRCVGSAEVMHDQLIYLAEVSQQPKVTIQVIPASIGVHAGLAGAAAIADTEDGGTLVHEDGFTAGRTSADPGIVVKVRERVAVLRSDALPREASLEMISKVAKERWSTS
jgi:transcriptional regulator with XRE-family HTH domain